MICFERVGVLLGPVDGYFGDVAITIFILQVAVLDAVFVDAFGDFNVITAVFGDIHHVLLVPRFFIQLPPAKRV